LSIYKQVSSSLLPQLVSNERVAGDEVKHSRRHQIDQIDTEQTELKRETVRTLENRAKDGVEGSHRLVRKHPGRSASRLVGGRVVACRYTNRSLAACCLSLL
jgi:hypothetical protein